MCAPTYYSNDDYYYDITLYRPYLPELVDTYNIPELESDDDMPELVDSHDMPELESDDDMPALEERDDDMPELVDSYAEMYADY